jgi:Leu/Phe-tRNA-protein transferase
MWLHYTAAGFLIMRPEDDPYRIVNVLLETDYNKDFCVSLDFDPDFIARLMKAGFLVMSSRILDLDAESEKDSGYFILLPRLHLTRSILFFDNLHIKKSIKRHLGRFELRPNADFDYILDRCIQVHGDDWLTPPLVAAVRNIRRDKLHGVYPTSFALYHNEKLVAGEFGIISGKVYTSYSGYYDESNAGTVQLILTTRYLQEHGFAFFDLGMPLDYKTALGATDVSPQEFVEWFRGKTKY